VIWLAKMMSQRKKISGIGRVLEETMTCHHLWELTDHAALACKMYLHLHSWRFALPAMHATTNAHRNKQSLSFLCSRLTPTGEDSLLFVTPDHLPAQQILIHSTRDLSFWSERTDLGS
jgi:hypothetical protein